MISFINRSLCICFNNYCIINDYEDTLYVGVIPSYYNFHLVLFINNMHNTSGKLFEITLIHIYEQFLALPLTKCHIVRTDYVYKIKPLESNIEHGLCNQIST